MPYVDPQTIDNPTAGNPIPAAWGDTVRADLEFLVDPPACSVYKAAVSVGSSITLAALAADQENYDNDSMHSTVTNNSRITIKTAGRYEIGCVVLFGASGTGNRTTAFRVNGTTDYTVDLRVGTATNTTGVSGSRTLTLAVNDYVEVVVWQNSGGPLNITLDEFYAIFRTR